MSDTVNPAKLPVPYQDAPDEGHFEAPPQGLFARFAFPPGKFDSRRIVRDEELYWTRYYKLVDDASLAEIKVSYYDEAADNDGAKFAKDMKDYFEFKAVLFPTYKLTYTIGNPPPLFDSIFERQIESCFKSDEDVRAIIEDFKNVCKGNFYQKMCGKRFLQWIGSAAYAGQMYVMAVLFLFATSGGLLLANVLRFWNSDPSNVATVFGTTLISIAAFLVARHLRNSYVRRIKAHLGKTPIQVLYWTEWTMISWQFFWPMLVIVVALLPLPVPESFISIVPLSREVVQAIGFGIVTFVSGGILGSRLLIQCDRNVSTPLEGMNDLLHKRFNDVTDSSAAFFVNAMQKRLHQLHLVTSHLDKRVDFEENLPGRGRQAWGARAKTWTKVIILAAKRVEYIEKHIQLEMWRVRMAHWSYHGVSDFLANVFVPYLALSAALVGSMYCWWAIVALAVSLSPMSPYAWFAALAPFIGALSVAVVMTYKVTWYELKLLNRIVEPIVNWLAGEASLDTVRPDMLDKVPIPQIPSLETLSKVFFFGPLVCAAVALIAVGYFSVEGFALILGWLVIPWLGLYRSVDAIIGRVVKEKERTKGRWQTDINFLNHRIDSSRWEKFTDLRLPQLLGRQVERDKHKINELKSRNRPEASA